MAHSRVAFEVFARPMQIPRAAVRHLIIDPLRRAFHMVAAGVVRIFVASR